MKNKKIVILIKNIDGGTGTFVNQFSRLSHFDGVKNDIFLLSLQKEKNTKLAKFKYISYFSTTKKRDFYSLKPLEIFELFKEIEWIKKEVLDIQPDIIISIDTHCNLLAALMKTLFVRKAKLVITTHNNIERVVKAKLTFFTRLILRFLAGKLFFNADYIVCNSNGVKKSFSKFFKINRRLYVIPYGLNLEVVKDKAKKDVQRSDRKVFSKRVKRVISIGRLEDQKDFGALIKAFKHVVLKIPQVNLIILGDGKNRHRLEKLIKNFGLSDKIFILGWRRNIYPYLAKSDVFVLSSHFEGFGYVILEAMSQKLPIISTNSPYGPSEILGNGKYGVLVNVGDKKNMAKKILELVVSKKLTNEYSKKSAMRIHDYSEDEMLKSYLRLFQYD